MDKVKEKLSEFKVKFFISELFMIFISTLTYRVCCISMNKNIASVISILFSLFCNYFMCLKYVFNNRDIKKNLLFQFIKFMMFGVLVLLLKKWLITKMYYSLLLSLFFSKIFAFIFLCFVDYYFKQFIFINNYNISIDKFKSEYSLLLKKWNNFIDLKYINFIFKFLPHNIFLLIFLLGSLYYMSKFFLSNNDMSVYNQVVSDDTIQLIDKSKTIDFSNYVVNQDIDVICLVFGTYGRKNTSKLDIKLLKNNKELYVKNVDASKLINAGGYCFDVPVIAKQKISNYKLEVIPINATPNNSVALFLNKETEEPTLYLKKKHNIISFKYFILLILIIIFLGINFFIGKNKKIKETTFLLMSLFYFGTFLFLNPPFEAPDEPSHFYSSYNLSQNGLKGSKVTNIVVPNNIDCLNYAGIQNRDRITNFNDVNLCMKSGKNVKQKVMYKVSKAFLGHLPQAISIKFIDVFTNSPVLIFYFARFGNFIISFLILYFAVKICPKYKNIILFIGLTPMFVQQITSLSYDAILNSLSLLFASYIVSLIISKRKIKSKDIIIPTIFLIFMLSVKIVYAPLILFLVFIPKECFNNKKQRVAYYLSIILISLLANYLIGNVLINLGPVIDSSTNQNLNYILNDPLKLIPIAIKTIQMNGWFYVQGMVGFFDWFRFALSDFTIICWLVCLVLLILSNKNILNDKSKFKFKKVVSWFGILISIAGVFASMYFCWSKYKLDYVDGVQGRYFIPLLIFILILSLPKSRKITLNSNFVYYFCNIMLFQTLFYLITYFY